MSQQPQCNHKSVVAHVLWEGEGRDKGEEKKRRRELSLLNGKDRKTRPWKDENIMYRLSNKMRMSADGFCFSMSVHKCGNRAYCLCGLYIKF